MGSGRCEKTENGQRCIRLDARHEGACVFEGATVADLRAKLQAEELKRRNAEVDADRAESRLEAAEEALREVRRLCMDYHREAAGEMEHIFFVAGAGMGPLEPLE